MYPSPAIVCIGEICWDLLPAGRQVGGAPYQVATHLQRLGWPVQLVSRVGPGERGADLLARLGAEGLDTSGVQQSLTLPTGLCPVGAGGSEARGPLMPVAWDELEYSEELRTSVAGSAALVYGTLAARHPAARETLYRLLQVAPFKVLDVNLRAPHYSKEVVKYLLRQADVVKLNQAELTEITRWLGLPAAEAPGLAALAEHFGLRAVCLSKGVAGATLWADGQLHGCPGTPAALPPATGRSGPFLAALLAGWLRGQTPADCLQAACAAAATTPGGPPPAAARRLPTPLLR
jgi:fructokinase